MNLQNVNNIEKEVWQNIPKFYQEIVKTWVEINKDMFNDRKPETYIEIRKQVIWGNKLIQFQKKSLFYNHWIQSNIIHINRI